VQGECHEMKGAWRVIPQRDTLAVIKLTENFVPARFKTLIGLIFSPPKGRNKRDEEM